MEIEFKAILKMDIQKVQAFLDGVEINYIVIQEISQKDYLMDLEDLVLDKMESYKYNGLIINHMVKEPSISTDSLYSYAINME